MKDMSLQGDRYSRSRPYFLFPFFFFKQKTQLFAAETSICLIKMSFFDPEDYARQGNHRHMGQRSARVR